MTSHGKEHERLEETPHALAYDNLLLVFFGLLGIGAVVFAMWVFGPADGESGEGPARCESIVSDRARLACYDRLAIPQQPTKGAFAPAPTQPRERTQ